MRRRQKKDPRKRGGEYSDEKSQVLSIWLHNAIARVSEVRTCDTKSTERARDGQVSKEEGKKNKEVSAISVHKGQRSRRVYSVSPLRIEKGGYRSIRLPPPR